MLPRLRLKKIRLMKSLSSMIQRKKPKSHQRKKRKSDHIKKCQHYSVRNVSVIFE